MSTGTYHPSARTAAGRSRRVAAVVLATCVGMIGATGAAQADTSPYNNKNWKRLTGASAEAVLKSRSNPTPFTTECLDVFQNRANPRYAVSLPKQSSYTNSKCAGQVGEPPWTGVSKKTKSGWTYTDGAGGMYPSCDRIVSTVPAVVLKQMGCHNAAPAKVKFTSKLTLEGYSCGSVYRAISNSNYYFRQCTNGSPSMNKIGAWKVKSGKVASRTSWRESLATTDPYTCGASTVKLPRLVKADMFFFAEAIDIPNAGYAYMCGGEQLIKR